MREAGDADDVGSMAAAGAFGVIGVDRPAADGRDGVFEEAGLVERVGMDGDLHVEAVGYIQASANRGGSRAPVLVQLQATGAGADLFLQRAWQAAVALAEETEVDREALRRLEHPLHVKRAGRAGGGVGPGGGASAAAEERRQAGRDGCLDQLWTDEVDVRVDAAGGQNEVLT